MPGCAMSNYAKNWVLLVSGLLVCLPPAFAQNQFSHVRLNPPRAQAVPAFPAFRTPVRSSLRSATAAHPTTPIVVRMPAPPAQHRGMVSIPSQPTLGGNSAVTVVSNPLFPPDSFIDLSNLGPFLNTSTPGLGFDFPHLAALNRDLGVRAIIDPVTQHELALTEQLLNSRRSVATSAFIPFFGGADYSEPVAYEQQQQQPQIIVLQQPAQQAQSTEEAVPSAASSSTAPEQPPLPPVGEFVLVLRSGKQIKAVAFTRQDDSIVYVSGDGARNSFPVAELDSAATKLINQQHGTPLKLPF